MLQQTFQPFFLSSCYSQDDLKSSSLDIRGIKFHIIFHTNKNVHDIHQILTWIRFRFLIVFHVSGLQTACNIFPELLMLEKLVKHIKKELWKHKSSNHVSGINVGYQSEFSVATIYEYIYISVRYRQIIISNNGMKLEWPSGFHMTSADHSCGWIKTFWKDECVKEGKRKPQRGQTAFLWNKRWPMWLFWAG